MSEEKSEVFPEENKVYDIVDRDDNTTWSGIVTHSGDGMVEIAGVALRDYAEE